MSLHEKSVGLLSSCVQMKRERKTDRQTDRRTAFLWMFRSDAIAPKGRESCGRGLRVVATHDIACDRNGLSE